MAPADWTRISTLRPSNHNGFAADPDLHAFPRWRSGINFLTLHTFPSRSTLTYPQDAGDKALSHKDARQVAHCVCHSWIELRKSKREQFLDEMEQVVPWGEFQALVEPYYPKGENGRPPVGLAIMLRVYFLQQWFNLSDPGAQEALPPGFLIVRRSHASFRMNGPCQNSGFKSVDVTSPISPTESFCPAEQSPERANPFRPIDLL
jgi:transposase-like protein DUF772